MIITCKRMHRGIYLLLGLSVTLVLTFGTVNGGPVQRAWSPSLPFEDCGSGVDLVAVQISSCQTAPCEIPTNHQVTVTAEFANSQANTQILRHEAYWVLNTINTRATVSPDTCDGRWCPFTATNGLAFAVELYAPKDFPALRGTLYWRVYGSDNRMLMCFRVPIALTR